MEPFKYQYQSKCQSGSSCSQEQFQGSQNQLNTPPSSKTTTPTTELAPPLPCPHFGFDSSFEFPNMDLSDLADWDFVNANDANANANDEVVRANISIFEEPASASMSILTATATGISAPQTQAQTDAGFNDNDSDDLHPDPADQNEPGSSSMTSSYLSSASHSHSHGHRYCLLDQDGRDTNMVACLLRHRHMCPDSLSPEFKRQKRQETWEEISARILCHTEAFFQNWRPVVGAMNLKQYPEQETKSTTFAHDDEFEEFFRRVLRAWAYEHLATASAANLVGFLYVCGFGILADKVREEIAAGGDSASVKRRSWMQAQRTTHLFTGRQSVLLRLHQLVMDAHAPGSVSRTLFTVITGLGGMGKTELIRFYGRAFSDYFDRNVLWIGADDKMKMRQSFMKLAVQDLQIDIEASTISNTELAGRCYAHFSTASKYKSLFIFDNAESYDGEVDGVVEFLPVGSLLEESPLDKAPYIILTSRAAGPNTWPVAEFKTLYLEPWTPPESVTFLQQAMPGASVLAYKSLAEELGHYPLALRQAVGYITSSCSSSFSRRYSFRSLEERISTFLDQFQFQSHAHMEEILNFGGGSFSYTSQYQGTVYVILTMTLSKIGPLPKQLLARLAFMGPDKIPVDWLLENPSGSGNFDEKESESEASVYSVEMAVAIERLARFLLIRVMDSDSGAGTMLQVHRLVQKLVRQQLEPVGSTIQQLTAVLQLLAPKIHSVQLTIKEYIATSLSEERKLCVSHSAAFCNHFLAAGADVNLDLHNFDLGLLHTFVCDVLHSLVALDHCREGLTLAQGFCQLYVSNGTPSTHARVLELEMMVGRLFLRLNSCPAALEQFLKVKKAAEEVGVDGCMNLFLSATFHAGWAYNRLTKWEEARICYEECLKSATASEANAAADEGSLRFKLFALSGIANVERSQYDRLDSALERYRTILDTPDWERVLDDDERVQLVYQQTGIVLKRLGLFSEVVPLLQRNVTRLERKYGPHASLTLVAKIKLLDGLLDDDRVEEASRLANDIHGPARSKLGALNLQFFQLEEHRLRIRELQEGASAKVLDEVHEGHMAILTAKLDGMRLGEGTVSVIHTHRKLCEVEAAKGNFVAAKERAELVLQKQLQVKGWGPEHGDVKWTQAFLDKVEDQLRDLSLQEEDPNLPSLPSSGGGNLEQAVNLELANPVPVSYGCPSCPFVSSRRNAERNIRRHLEEKHSVLGYLPGRELPLHGPVFKFECEQCGKVWHRDYKLRDHKCTVAQSQ